MRQRAHTYPLDELDALLMLAHARAVDREDDVADFDARHVAAVAAHHLGHEAARAVVADRQPRRRRQLDAAWAILVVARLLRVRVVRALGADEPGELVVARDRPHGRAARRAARLARRPLLVALVAKMVRAAHAHARACERGARGGRQGPGAV